MAGWIFEWDSVIQFLPQLVPIQFNTALTFFMSGFALLAERNYRRASAAAAAFVLFFALLTGLQYVANGDFGIDTFFLKPFFRCAPRIPGAWRPTRPSASCCSR